MNIKKQFEYDPAIEVSACQIGISKWNWISTNSNNEQEAIKIMKEKRFDVLPIEDPNGKINSFFSTQEWNVYDSLNKNQIKGTQKIYYRLSLKDLVRKFKEEEKHYYFLTDYDQILGLVSYVNLNCQLVYNYLFHIIADIEKSVSELLKEYVSQGEVLSVFAESSDTHIIDVVNSFEQHVENNDDNDIFQHMYLQTVGIALKKFLSKLPGDSKKIAKYSSKFGSEGVDIPVMMCHVYR